MKDNERFIFLLIASNILTLCILFGQPKVEAVQPEPVTIVREVLVEVEPPEPVYSITSVERELIARLLYTEARGESSDCQKAIVSVIFNRCEARNMSISDVIYQEGQFDLASQLYKITPNEKEYESVDYVLQNGKTVPDWVQYFRANKHHNWDGYVGYCIIDNTYFGGIKSP